MSPPEPDAPEPRDELEPVAHGRALEPVSHELEPRRRQELDRWTPYEQQQVHKFRLAFAALAGFGLAAVAAAGVFLISGRPPKPPAWSEWKPSTSGTGAITQIAEHVGPNYRMPGGQQLVLVEGGPLQIAGLPVRVVLRKGATGFTPLEGKGALYVLCGAGAKCSIKSGKPSTERMLLLRREALELALYTFRYVGGVKQVVVLMPPGKAKDGTVPDPSVAMFFRKGDVSPQLDRPLRFTLPSPPPSIRSLHCTPAGSFVDRLTSGELFSFDLQQAQDASVFMFLARPQLGSSSTSCSHSSSP